MGDFTDCHHCTDPLDETIDYDDDGNPYHPECADLLRTKWDDWRLDQLAEQAYQED